MRIITFTWLLLTLVLSSCKTVQPLSTTDQKTFLYHYKVDLGALEGDKLRIELDIEGLVPENLTFCLPKIVPGIYGAMDFGQYVSNLNAVDKRGNTLRVQRIDTNCWSIAQAYDLDRISYQVDDAWEEFGKKNTKGFYRSSASTFKENSFVINSNCLFGYFRGYTQHPVEVIVDKPASLYAATSLKNTSESTIQDVFKLASYHDLLDQPILYASPDTSLIRLPNIEVEVACFSTSGEKIADEIATFIEPLLVNQSKYLGDKLPVDKYTFIIYHHSEPDQNFYMGDGLEHSNSTLILLYMPLDREVIKQTVYGIASHEFFHILMPLGLHSHEIEDYDYNDPKFSQHLWLYEGMTEYFTIHMPVKTGVQSEEAFCKVLESKISEMQSFDPDLSLTALSKAPMEKQDQYYNVYLKGALLNLCLDIRLRELSKGAFGVQNLVEQLIKKYGPDRPFEDEELFDEIIELTGFSELGSFFQEYVVGTKPLPLATSLEKAGFLLTDGQVKALKDPSPQQLKLRQDWLK